MSNRSIMLTEHFHTQTEEERQKQWQIAMDRYIRLVLERAGDGKEGDR